MVNRRGIFFVSRTPSVFENNATTSETIRVMNRDSLRAEKKSIFNRKHRNPRSSPSYFGYAGLTTRSISAVMRRDEKINRKNSQGRPRPKAKSSPVGSRDDGL